MEFTNPQLLLYSGQSFLFFLAVVLIYRITREKKVLARHLDHSSREILQLKKKNLILDSQLEQLRSFQDKLRSAELTTKLQKPRLKDSAQPLVPESPERYLYISSLHQKGMDPQEIATILRLSQDEIEQILALSRIAQKN